MSAQQSVYRSPRCRRKENLRSYIKDTVRIQQVLQRSTRRYRFSCEKVYRVPNKHDVHCRDKPAFSNGRILYADLPQIRCDTQQNTADDASGQCLFPGSGFFLRSPNFIFCARIKINGSSTIPRSVSGQQ